MMLSSCYLARCYDRFRDNFFGILMDNLLSYTGDNAFSACYFYCLSAESKKKILSIGVFKFNLSILPILYLRMLGKRNFGLFFSGDLNF
jgi:hypothetical protein